MNMNLEELNLSTKDFDIMIEALDHLPNKSAASNMMVDMLGMALIKDEEEQEKMRKKSEERDRKQKQEKLALVDDINILKGKLSLLKRMLIEKNILQQVDDGLNGK